MASTWTFFAWILICKVVFVANNLFGRTNKYAIQDMKDIEYDVTK